MNSYYQVGPEKPGYCSNPFDPLLNLELDHDDPTILDLVNSAISYEEFGFKADFMSDLDHWILSLKKDIFSFYRIGLIAWKLKLYKAWEKRCCSFASFCCKFLGRSAAAINNHIRAAVIISKLIAAGFRQLPQSVSQCMELYRADRNLEIDLIEVWSDILSKYDYEKITADVIKSELMPIDDRPPQKKTIRIDMETWERLQETAANAGLTPNELLKQLVGLGNTEEVEADDTTNDEQETEQKRTPSPTRGMLPTSPKLQRKTTQKPFTREVPITSFIPTLVQSVMGIQVPLRE